MVPSFEKRVRAFAIDTSGVTIVVILSMFTGTIHPYVPWILVSLGFFGFYFLPYFFSNGQSFGKKIQKIKIVKVDDSTCSIWRIIIRDLFKLTLSIATFGIYLVISFFVMSDKTSRTIHDYIFQTKVVDLEKPTGKSNILGKTESMRKRGF